MRCSGIRESHHRIRKDFFLRFADLINAYNMDHPTQRFQYSIFYLVSGDSYPLVVLPDQDRELALRIPTNSKRLRSHLRQGDLISGSAHLANHTCCPQHRKAELRILSVWQGGREGQASQGADSSGAPARSPGATDRTLVATLRATKFISERHAHSHLLQEYHIGRRCIPTDQRVGDSKSAFEFCMLPLQGPMRYTWTLRRFRWRHPIPPP